MKAKNFFMVLLIILLLATITVLGLFVYRDYFKKDTAYIGVWTRQLDLTDYVTDAMDVWLDEAGLGDGTDYGEDRVTITMTMTLSEDGTYTETMTDEEYEETCREARLVATAGLLDFLERRMEFAGAGEETVGKSASELIEESLGMSAGDYLDLYGPALLPDKDELRSMYNRVGTYEVGGGQMIRSTEKETVTEHYILQGDYLIFTDAVLGTQEVVDIYAGSEVRQDESGTYPVMYRRK